MWAVGMAIGIVFIDKTEGYKVDLMSYLFGSILTVPAGTLWIMLVLNVHYPGVGGGILQGTAGDVF